MCFSFPLEMHIVHSKVGLGDQDPLKVKGGLAVTGFFFEVSLIVCFHDEYIAFLMVSLLR